MADTQEKVFQYAFTPTLDVKMARTLGRSIAGRVFGLLDGQTTLTNETDQRTRCNDEHKEGPGTREHHGADFISPKQRGLWGERSTRKTRPAVGASLVTK